MYLPILQTYLSYFCIVLILLLRCDSDDGSTTLTTLKAPSGISTHTHKPSGQRILPRISGRTLLRHNFQGQSSLRGTRLLVILRFTHLYGLTKPDDTKQHLGLRARWELKLPKKNSFLQQICVYLSSPLFPFFLSVWLKLFFMSEAKFMHTVV